MNLLIVDDEISSIRAVSHMLDWETIGIDHCFTALSAAEARQYMEENQIDLLLCDIEMPQQSGLELLEWVNKQQLQISCIYMTCYAEFSYAQKAIQLGSEAYLLKPIDPDELKSVLTAAIQKRQALQAAQSASRLMEEDCDNLCHQFWQELFYEDIPSNRPAIAARIGQLGLPLDPAWYYCTCLVVVRNWGKDMETTHRLNRYAVHNVVAELFEGAAGPASSFFTVFPFGQHGQMCICGGEDGAALFRCCRSFAEQYLASERKYLEVRSVCYLGQPTHIEDAAEEMECLMRMDNSHLKNNGISVHGKAEPALPVESDLEERFQRWNGLLEDGQLEKARTEIVAYLSSQEDNVWFNKKRFQQFNSRYSGLLTAYAEKHHFPLNQLTADPQNAHCRQAALPRFALPVLRDVGPGAGQYGGVGGALPAPAGAAGRCQRRPGAGHPAVHRRTPVGKAGHGADRGKRPPEPGLPHPHFQAGHWDLHQGLHRQPPHGAGQAAAGDQPPAHCGRGLSGGVLQLHQLQPHFQKDLRRFAPELPAGSGLTLI